MNVIVTIVLIAGLGMWAAAVYSRLVRLRSGVKEAWLRLEPDQANTVLRKVYNDRVKRYNAALDAFPAYLIAPLTGLKPAKQFQ